MQGGFQVVEDYRYHFEVCLKYNKILELYMGHGTAKETNGNS